MRFPTIEQINSISSERARELLEKAKSAKPVLRSCGYCNGAHDHLMNDDDDEFCFMCFSCGVHYVSGYAVPFLFIRAQGNEVTEEKIEEFKQAVQESRP